MARVMSTVIGFTKGTASGARIVLYLVRNFKSVSRSILDLGPRVMAKATVAAASARYVLEFRID